ncbi:MAG TPA: protein phosphatase 2C domain-containing protein [Pyrinomonadaceae bacterium]|nr:protein phosphatase 2C domain-containing protein [Pyrinomonadaceae bacterium]
MPTDPNARSDSDTLELLPPQWFFPGLSLPTSGVRVDIAGASHQGHKRKNNEDHYLAVRFQRSLETLSTNVKEGHLISTFEETGYGMVVADGMGGMAGGEVASRMALCKLIELVVNTPDWFMRFSEPEDVVKLTQRITQRFHQIDEALKNQTKVDPSLLGMGTTLTLGVSLGSHLLVGHIGDSRAYLVREEKMHQLTSDHTLAQALIDAGIVRPDDPTTRTTRHVLTTALGAIAKGTEPEVQRVDIKMGDQVLLCTDGLTEMVPDDQIAAILNSTGSSDNASQELINAALDGGGRDNITVVIARYGE